jgi:hypothetical protein
LAEPSRLLLVKLNGELLRVADLRCYLYREIGLVFAGEHLVRHQIQNLHQFGGMMLADREDDRLTLAADRVAQGILQKYIAEHLIGGFGKEAFLELALLIDLLLAKSSLERSCVAISLRASTTIGLTRSIGGDARAVFDYFIGGEICGRND